MAWIPPAWGEFPIDYSSNMCMLGAMRRITVALAIIGSFALPASAVEQECVTAEITYSGESPIWHGEADWSPVRTAGVGTYLWIEFEGNLSSVAIPPNAVMGTACADGSASFVLAAHTTTPPEPEPICDCTPEEYARFIEPAVFGAH